MDNNFLETIETPRDNYTMVPNIIDDMNLSLYAFRLYCHIRRVAGEHGASWQGTRKLAKSCGMSVGAVSKAKQELKDAHLITIEEKEANGNKYHHIAIVDIWSINHTRYSGTCSPGEHPCSYSEHQCSPGERNNIPSNNIPHTDETSKDEVSAPAQEPLNLVLDDSQTTDATIEEDYALFNTINADRKANGQRAIRVKFDTIQQKVRWRFVTTTAQRLYNGRHPEVIAEWVTAAMEKGIRNKARIISYTAKCAENNAEKRETPLRVQ